MSAKPQQTKPQVSPEEDASNTRQMLVSGLTGMPTPNMTEQDRASFERGKMAGGVSVPIVAGSDIRGICCTGTSRHSRKVPANVGDCT